MQIQRVLISGGWGYGNIGDDAIARLCCRLRWMASICAMFVVCIHMPLSGPRLGAFSYFYEFWVNGLCQVAVPFFFVASGFFLASRIGEMGWYALAIRKRIKSILIPYCFTAVLYCAFSAGLSVARDAVLGLDIRPVLSKVMIDPMCVFGLNLIFRPQLGLLWFLRCLFVLVLLSPLLVRLSSGGGGVILMFLLHFLIYPYLGVPIPEGSMRYLFVLGPLSVIGVAYFSLGLFLRKNMGCFESVFRFKYYALSAAIACWIVRAILVCHGHNAAATYFGGLGVFPALIGLLGVMPSEIRVPPFIAGAFPLFLMHRFFIDAYFYVVVACGLQCILNRIDVFLLSTLAVITTTFLFVIMLRVLMPKATVLLFGGR